jgi:hypothetical protein
MQNNSDLKKTNVTFKNSTSSNSKNTMVEDDARLAVSEYADRTPNRPRQRPTSSNITLGKSKKSTSRSPSKSRRSPSKNRSKNPSMLSIFTKKLTTLFK